MRRAPLPKIARRTMLLQTLGTLSVASAAATPFWLRSAFAGVSCALPAPANNAAPKPTPPPRRVPHSQATFRAALDRATQRGKPLLVLVIPPSSSSNGFGDAFDRGSAFGAYLNHGSPAQLAPLALVDVVCALREEVAAEVPGTPAGDPLAFLVETDGSGAIASMAAPLVPVRSSEPAAEDAAVDVNIERIAQLFAGATLHDAGALARWETQSARVLSARERTTLDADLAAGKQIAVDRLDRGAAFVTRRASLLGGAEPAHAANLLGAVAAFRFTKRTVAGSLWARESGCGMTVENDPTPMSIGCGMGHVPEKAQRFLHFLAP